ncbi:hypothetical protein [Streptomyces sp. NPDC020965]|uniref:hypothetical protein n=1 Tax=Streptomyces sp. NPDC020965 TaxID=3365105 RepID=UPI0037B9C518
MARHTAQHSRRIGLRAGLTVAAVAATFAAGETAHAAPAPPAGGLDALTQILPLPTTGVAGAVTNSVSGIGYLKNLQLNPLAKTGVDPLTNGVGTQIADFKPISTTLVTGALSEGGGLKDLPLVGGVVQALPL